MGLYRKKKGGISGQCQAQLDCEEGTKQPPFKMIDDFSRFSLITVCICVLWVCCGDNSCATLVISAEVSCQGLHVAEASTGTVIKNQLSATANSLRCCQPRERSWTKGTSL